MFAVGLFLFAQAGKPAGSPLDRVEILYAAAGIILALAAGAVILFFADKWRKRTMAEVTYTAEELTSFREMYERGEITEAEYDRLRDKVATRVKSTNSPTPPPGGPGGLTGLAAPPQSPPPANPGPPPSTNGSP